jgi:hypothetical protein
MPIAITRNSRSYVVVIAEDQEVEDGEPCSLVPARRERGYEPPIQNKLRVSRRHKSYFRNLWWTVQSDRESNGPNPAGHIHMRAVQTILARYVA